MALLPQNPRDQKLFVMGLLAVGLVGIYQQLYWKPKADEQAILAARLDTLDSLGNLVLALQPVPAAHGRDFAQLP